MPSESILFNCALESTPISKKSSKIDLALFIASKIMFLYPSNPSGQEANNSSVSINIFKGL